MSVICVIVYIPKEVMTMADYIDRADLICNLHNLCKISCTHYPSERDIYCDMCMLGDVYAFIKKKSVVDVTPVVRCKECANWARADGKAYGSCSIDALIRNEDFWCANGVKDDDGEDVEGWQ